MTTLLPKNAVAARLGISTKTLERMTVAGEGPPPTRVGHRVLWRSDLLEAWITVRS